MEKKFSIPFKEIHLIGDVLMHDSEKPNMLVLHGAGQADRSRYRALRDFLFHHGIGSAAFDFIGAGATGGVMSSSSLAQRIEQMLSVIAALKMHEPLTLIGASMGAYIALKVSEIKQVSNLILIVPGMYAREAYQLPFNEKFSEALRKPMSWMNSDAWDILPRFRGKLLIIAAAKDKVVPRELTQKIFGSATHAAKRELSFIEDSPHGIMKYLAEERPEVGRLVFQTIFDFIQS